jgi:uncharacterized protein with PIN domain
MRIINKVDHSLKRNETHCPYCNSDNVKINSHSQTLVGGDPDPNHHTIHATCLSCNKDFWKEYQHANVWYSEPLGEEKLLLKGLPSCFEDWVYTCECGGHIRRSHKEMDGVTEAKILTLGGIGKTFRVFWTCDSCGTEETDFERPYNEVWQKTVIEVDKILKEGKEYESQPYKSDNPKYSSDEKIRTKNVLRFHTKVVEQSHWYYDKNNEWKRRKKYKRTHSVKRVKMYFMKEWSNEEAKWTYNLPWRVFEEVGIAVINPRGISKLTL